VDQVPVAFAWVSCQLIFTLPLIEERSIVISMFVCPQSHLQNYTSDVHQIFYACYLTAVAQSFSGGIVIHCVFPVLWMTSYLHIS